MNNVGKTCYIIPSDLKCLKMTLVDFDGTVENSAHADYIIINEFAYTCDLCAPKYFRRNKNVDFFALSDPATAVPKTVFYCETSMSYMREECEVHASESGLVNIGEGGCQGCSTDYYPYDFSEKYVCLDFNYLIIRQENFQPIDNLDDRNCLAYAFDGVYKCTQCRTGWFLHEDDATCLTEAECTGGLKAILATTEADTLKLITNRCMTSVVTLATNVADCGVYVIGRN